MFTAVRTAVAALAVVTPLCAQSIDSVAPASGAPGTLITITGSEFGTAKPKVWLSQEGSKKKRKLKVVSVADGEIVAELKKAELGTFDVNVQVKGKGIPLATDADAFTVPMPTFDDIEIVGDDETISPGVSVMFSGDDFGNRKPRVKVGKKKVKVTAFDDDSFTFIVPKIHDGAHDVEVRTAVVTVPIFAGLAVEGSSITIGETDTASYRLDKKKFKIGGFLQILVTGSDGMTSIAMSSGGFPSYQLELELPVDSLDESLPVAFVGSPDASLTLVYTEQLFGDSTTWVSSNDIGEVIKVQSVKDGVATVEFSGTLTRTEGEFGKETVTISQGIVSPSGQ